MMITKLSESSDTALLVQASGHLTHEDYQTTFIPELQRLINIKGKARVLLYMDEGFEGWEMQAAWDDAKFGLAHRNDFSKLAIVGGPKWVAWGVRLSETLISGEIKMFEPEQLSEAKIWIKD